MKICEDGTFASDDGKECLLCLVGNYCINGEKHLCQEGRNCSKEGLTEEHSCAEGFHCFDPAKPIQCEKGTYNDLQNQKQERSAK